ncbi:MAG: type II toxin-antitoxin system HicA family toxin [Gammaproteobacteria bacterium]|nr:type II toxin-antitoxin system HicA family toxin [Gammaproteobacteria bacterium]
MKLPRDLSGSEVARRLARHYGYRVTRSRGSQVTVTLTAGGQQHQVTVPRHPDVRIGTLDAIIADVAAFLGLPKQAVRDTLFG